jgi:hypothetical protein
LKENPYWARLLGVYFIQLTRDVLNTFKFVLLFIAALAIFSYLAAVTITGDRATKSDL